MPHATEGFAGKNSECTPTAARREAQEADVFGTVQSQVWTETKTESTCC